MSNNLRERIQRHAEQVKIQEEAEAVQAGVSNTQSFSLRNEFTFLARQVVKPAMEEFKQMLRDVGRDAVIVDHVDYPIVQSIGISLVDRYLRSKVGKTITLVNPKQEVSSGPRAKYYEVICTNECIISVRQKVDSDIEPISTDVSFSDINAIFLENELACFFERAYPTA